MSFPTFSDFDKPINDLIKDDFDTKFTLKIKSPAPFGLTFTTTTDYECCAKEGSPVLNPKISTKWVHSSGFTLEKLEIDSKGGLKTETSLVDAIKDVKLEFQGNSTDKGDVSFTYNHPKATLTGLLDVLNFSKASAGVVGGQGPVTFGATANYDFNKSIVDTVSVAASYTAHNFTGVFRADKYFSVYSVLAKYVANKDVTLAGKVVQCSKSGTSGNVVALYKCNPDTTIKVKLATAEDSTSIFGSVKQAFDKKFNVIATAEVPSSFSTIKLGVNTTLG